MGMCGCTKSEFHVVDNQPESTPTSPTPIRKNSLTKPYENMALENKMLDNHYTSTNESCKLELKAFPLPLDIDALFSFCSKKESEENLVENEENRILVDNKYIRDEEKAFITFSKIGIYTFISKLLSESVWYEVYTDEKISLQGCREGTPLTRDHQLGKYMYKIKKNTFKGPVTMEFLMEQMYSPYKRKSYDGSIKDFSIFEGKKECYLFQISYFSPVFFISERDTVDKRITFFYKDAYYCLSTSVSEGFYPPEDNFVRVKNYLNFLKLEEDEENFIVSGLSQVDIKMPIPQFFLNMTLPFKMLAYFKALEDKVNEYIEISQFEEEERKRRENQNQVNVESSLEKSEITI